jgi:hypothetical protein
MRIDLLQLFTAANKHGEFDKLSDARYWTMSTPSQSGLPVDSVSWKIKDITDMIGTFSFKDGGSHTVVLSQDVRHVDMEGVEYDGASTTFPHVSIRPTIVGILPVNLAIIVKSSFNAGGEAKQYRFDCHIPIANLSDLFQHM